MQHRASGSSVRFPLGTPADWIADGHVTCNVQCNGCARMVDVRLDALPQGRPWAQVARSMVCQACGAGASNVVPNWHDMPDRAVPFTRKWRRP
ncbi:hypothetical protein [Bradyrhizobium sp. RDM4]|uniref:hypothetical protein n=1 Tax=Bradyrhizobium sp. RDM4 TaxID=3378765 RepID=UPI0038FC0277